MMDALVFFVLALLSALGVGSAGLPVVYLTLVHGVPQLTAQGTSLCFFVLSAGVSLLFQLLHAPPHRAVLLLIPAGLLGALFGVLLANALPGEILRMLFAAFLIATGAVGLLRSRDA